MLSASDDGDEIGPAQVPSDGARIASVSLFNQISLESVFFFRGLPLIRMAQKNCISLRKCSLAPSVRRVASLDSHGQLELISHRAEPEAEEESEAMNGHAQASESRWGWLYSLWNKVNPYASAHQGADSILSALSWICSHILQ